MQAAAVPTIPATTETKNTRRYREDSWLTSQSAANPSRPVTPCFPLLCLEKQAVFPSRGMSSGQYFFKFCRLFRRLWSFPSAARPAAISPDNRDIFQCFRDARLGNRGNSKRLRKQQLRSSPLLRPRPTRLATAAFIQSRGCPVPAYIYGLSRPFRVQAPVGKPSKTKDFLDMNSARATLFRVSA
jgi:hypothetical protein